MDLCHPWLKRTRTITPQIYLSMLGSHEDLILSSRLWRASQQIFSFLSCSHWMTCKVSLWWNLHVTICVRVWKLTLLISWWCYLHCRWWSGGHSSPSVQETWPSLAYTEHLGVILCAMNKLKLDLQELDRFQSPGNNPFWHRLLIPLPLSSPPFPTVKETLAAYFSLLFLTLWLLGSCRHCHLSPAVWLWPWLASPISSRDMVLFTTKHTALKSGCSAQGLVVTERHLWLKSQILRRRSSCWTLLFHSWRFSTMLFLTSETGWPPLGNTEICWLVQQHICTPAEANASWPAGPEGCSWSNGMEMEGKNIFAFLPLLSFGFCSVSTTGLHQGPAANGQRGTNSPPNTLALGPSPYFGPDLHFGRLWVCGRRFTSC